MAPTETTHKGQQLAPGITRIRGDLCNVHGKYGSCAAAGSGTATSRPSLRERLAATKKRPKKTPTTPATPATAASTPTRSTAAENQRQRDAAAAQRAQERTQRAQARRAEAERRRGAQQQAAAQRRVTQQQRASQQEAARVAQAAARETAQAERRRAREAARAARAQQAQARADAREAAQQAAAARKIEALVARRQVTTPALADAARQLASGTAPSAVAVQGLIRNGLAWVRNGTLVLTATGRQATRQKERQLLVVQKDACGRQRWLLISATAYRDRDGEIVSTKALTDDAARADRDGDYGPLLWWHIPIVLGDCDFNAMAGPLLIESGTFRSEEVATRIAQKQQQLGGSIAFTHPDHEPDRDGVFWHIRRHERSLLPRSRASNLFTRLVIKEHDMSAMQTERMQELATLLGVDTAQLDTMVDHMVTETKEAAESAGITQKEASVAADDPLAPPATDAATTEKACTNEQKAAPPPEAVMEASNESEDEGAGMLFDDAELQQIAAVIAPLVAQAVTEALGPLLNLEAKMRGYADEVKGLMGSAQTQKDAQQAELRSDLDHLKDQVATLTGEQPRAVARSGRPSERTDNVVTVTTAKEADPLAGLAAVVNNLLAAPNGPAA